MYCINLLNDDISMSLMLNGFWRAGNLRGDHMFNGDLQVTIHCAFTVKIIT